MLGQTLYTSRKRNQSKWKFWEFWQLRSKFTKLSFLKQQVFEIWITFSVSWDITPLHFFSWSFIYCQQKEPIKVQIWWNFMWAVTSQKFCTLMGLFCPNNIKLWLKKYRRVIYHDIEEWCKVQRKTVFWFQIWHEEFCDFSPNLSKDWKFHFDGVFLFKVCKVWAKKMKRSYLSWHWTVMQNLNKSWPCGFKNCWGIRWTFIRALGSLKNRTLIGSFCSKHIIIQPENFRGIMCYDSEGRCKI